jgi:hypothetical protein
MVITNVRIAVQRIQSSKRFTSCFFKALESVPDLFSNLGELGDWPGNKSQPLRIQKIA